MSLTKPIRHDCYRLVDPSTAFLVALILLLTGPVAICAMPHVVFTLLFNFIVTLNSSLSSYSNSNDVGESPDDVVHGLYYCRGAVNPEDCCGCVQAAVARVVLDCPSVKEAIIWYEECTLRYSSQVDVEDVWISEQAPTSNTVSITADLYGRLFDGLIKEAAYSNNNNVNGSSLIRYFMTGKTMVTSSVSLQGLVQCAPQMSESQCEGCLRTSVGVIPSCCGWRREWVTVFRPSCLVEYRYANAIPTNRDSSSSLLVPNAHSFWGYVKYFLTSVAVLLALTVAYYTLIRPVKYVHAT